MDSAVVLVLIALLAARVGNVAASCREVPNDDMVEYLCEGSHPDDLATVPETTMKLRISRMPLGKITADTFAKFGDNLWVLSCSHCEISDIEANAFRRLVNLQQLSLDNNRLTAVRASWFQGLDSLTYLDVNYNDISEIEDGVYQNLPSLVDFRVSGNRLRCLNLDEMLRLRQLKRMFLSENLEFACPHAVSEFLEQQHVSFERDPEWRRLSHDAIEVHVPPAFVEEEEEEEEQDSDGIDAPPVRGEERKEQGRDRVPARPERPYPERRPFQHSEVVPPLTEDRPVFHPAEHYGRRRKPMTTTTTSTARPAQLQAHLPRVEPIPAPGAKSPYQVPPDHPQTSRPGWHYQYPKEFPKVPHRELMPPPLMENNARISADRSPMTEHASHGTMHQTAPTSPPYAMSERTSSQDSRLSPEDIRLITDTVGLSSAQSTLIHPAYIPHAKKEEVPYPIITPEGSRVVGTGLPSDDATGSPVRPDRLIVTEQILTHPPQEATRQTTSYPEQHSTSNGPPIPPVTESEASSENELATSDGSSRHAETTVYPLHVRTSDGLERTPHGYIQVTNPSFRPTEDPDEFITYRPTWSTDGPMEPGQHGRPDNLQDGERREKRPSTSTTSARQETPYRMSIGRDYTSEHNMIVDEGWSSSTKGIFIVTDPPAERVEAERSRTTVSMPNHDETVHYVKPLPPSHPELMYPASTDDMYTPYYDSTVTMHPPTLLQERNHQEPNYQEGEKRTTAAMETTTDLPEDCPEKGSAPRARPASVLVTSIVVVIFGHIIVAGF